LPIDALLKIPGVDIETRKTGDATYYVATPKNISASDRRKAHLYIHGGGWIYFGGRGAMALTKVIALQYGGVVFGVDYRMPPDHMAPTALDDCLAVYREMLKQYDPSSILVSGESAGGNLAAALMLKARDVGVPAPSALFLNTPATDLTCEGDSWKTNDGLDPVLRGPLSDGGSMDLYLNGGDPRQPYFSPLFGDLTRGFPQPICTQARAIVCSRIRCACIPLCVLRVSRQISTLPKRCRIRVLAACRPKTTRLAPIRFDGCRNIGAYRTAGPHKHRTAAAY
jgi:epsilon-lactone hydrolase